MDRGPDRNNNLKYKVMVRSMNKNMQLALGVIVVALITLHLLNKPESEDAIKAKVETEIEKVEAVLLEPIVLDPLGIPKATIMPVELASRKVIEEPSNLQSEIAVLREMQSVINNPVSTTVKVGTATVVATQPISSGAAATLSKSSGSYVQTSGPSGTTIYRKV